VHFSVTEHPTEQWTMQQIREAFPWEQAPRYLIRDRDAIFGKGVIAITKGMGVEEVVTAPRSPWQLHSYFDYYARSRTRLALAKDTPERRAV
jgi:putative transposase